MRRDLEEGYRKLASILAVASREQQFCSVLVGSAMRGEGASTVTLQAAQELAGRHGLHPLVVELDFRKPRLLKKYNLDPERTLYAATEGLIPPCDAIQSHHCGVSFVACGAKRQVPVQDPAPVLCRLMDQARGKYSMILVDVPPVLENGSMLTIGSVIPRMILVVEAGRTSTEVLRRTKNELEQWHIALLGAVLNKQKRYMPRWFERLVQ